MKRKQSHYYLLRLATATMTAGRGDKQEAKRQHNCRKRCGTLLLKIRMMQQQKKKRKPWSYAIDCMEPTGRSIDVAGVTERMHYLPSSKLGCRFEYGVCAEGDAKATVTTDVEGSADVYMLANDNIPDLVAKKRTC